MINIKIIELEKHKDIGRYELVEKYIYKDLKEESDAKYRIAFSFELEEGEDTQYPLEDLLDKYYLHVSDFLEKENEEIKESVNMLQLELGGDLEDVKNGRNIVGKRVYTIERKGEEDNVYMHLVIE